MNNTNVTVIEPVMEVLNRATNERWFNFILEFGELVNHVPLDVLGITALYPAHLKLVATADDLLEQLRKSRHTAELKTLDTGRDTCTNGLKAAVKVLLKSPVEVKRKAAVNLNILLDSYGDIARKDYAAQTAATYNLLQDLNGKYAADVVAAELTDWVTELERLNKLFADRASARHDEKAEKPEGTLVEIRREVDQSLSRILTVIEATTYTTPTTELTDFVTRLNVLIHSYRTLAAQDKGRRKAKKAKDAKEEQPI
jgi:hypothetical protein